MSKYKVGDRVKIVRSPFCGESRRAGAVGTISRVPSRIRGEVEIEFEDDAGPWGFHFDEIEHVGYKPVTGDRVRVVLEGEVTEVWGNLIGVETGKNGKGNNIYSDASHVVSIEKIEPPVEVFKPGDRVRSLAGGAEYTLADLGYISHGSERTGKRGRWMAYTTTATQESHWTSRDYERVNLS